MNELWMKWIILSLSKYVQTYFASDYVWIQDMERKPNPPTDRYELRYMGPDFEIQQPDVTLCKLTLNCQIITGQQTNDMEAHLLRVGKALKMLAVCLPVYKYGRNATIDDKTQFNQFQLDSDITTTGFGTIDPVSRCVRTTVEASYKMTIEE